MRKKGLEVIFEFALSILNLLNHRSSSLSLDLLNSTKLNEVDVCVGVELVYL